MKYIYIITIIFFSISSNAQSTTVEARIANKTILTTGELQFDVELKASTLIYLSQSDIKISYNKAKFSNIIITRIAGSCAMLNDGGTSAAGIYSFGVTNQSTRSIFVININPVLPTDLLEFTAGKVSSTFVKLVSYKIAGFSGTNADDANLFCKTDGLTIHSLNKDAQLKSIRVEGLSNELKQKELINNK